MKFETQFDIGDHVWCMRDNKPTEVIISEIEIHQVSRYQTPIEYKTGAIIFPSDSASIKWRNEETLFKTKDELLMSL